MARLTNSLILAAALWGPTAQADDTAPPRNETSTEKSSTEPAPPGMTDEQVQKLAEGESIEIWDDRPDKAFDRDTEVRLTGEQLAARGAVDLGTALALIPDVTVRDAGRGGFNVDIRGARKGAVSVLIDGVLVTDPYYGTFDVSSIPVTDIVQIKVATTPQSPIDGPGGPGGVIEVSTRDAIGPQVVIGRLTADSLPSFGMTGTARVALMKHLALRMSVSGLGGARDLALPGNASLGENRYAATGAGRLEYRDGDRRIAVDGFLDDRHYISPPSDTDRSTILLIDRETSARASVKYDDKIAGYQIQAEAWEHYLLRHSKFYSDPAMTEESQAENLEGLRNGGMVLVTKPFWREFRWAASATVDHEKAVVSNIAGQYVEGSTTIIEPAADIQYEHKQFRGDVSAGLALPFGTNATLWPEFKAIARYKATPELELTATGAYKGRVPSLRERYDAATGNPDIGPERNLHSELRAAYHFDERIHVELAPFYKHTKGIIRASTDPMDMGHLVNLGIVNFYGVDTLVRIVPHPFVEVGGGYSYVKARSDDTGDDPIDRLPHNRWDAWVQGHPDPRYSVLARAHFFGASIDQGNHVGGYTIVEAAATGQITKDYLAVFRIDDLLNAQPETRAGYHTAGRVISLVVQGTWE